MENVQALQALKEPKNADEMKKLFKLFLGFRFVQALLAGLSSGLVAANLVNMSIFSAVYWALATAFAAFFFTIGNGILGALLFFRCVKGETASKLFYMPLWIIDLIFSYNFISSFAVLLTISTFCSAFSSEGYTDSACQAVDGGAAVLFIAFALFFVSHPYSRAIFLNKELLASSDKVQHGAAAVEPV
ncbi:Hypothetical Protein FCC1311_007852 [Hondaea fermentalgiana]|uniref:Uncharacterized protein n=1 Tax=Hondaea fermentalgiana TaxID=2315210 RepID=A0A2R5G0K6_9STRA|nr:Hypothetical Protein FCC1311_007852 [Hondaea fermentalgiana]|eukprot:GBG24566.1 Hypothetical Protein FCC1311_007852 [Hondaea fermentalgiana]